MRTARFPQLAVRCSWCAAPTDQLCTNPATGLSWHNKTHDARRIDWVIKTTTCPVCASAPGYSCLTTRPPLMPLTSPHPERITAADRAHTATHRTPPWPHSAPTADDRSAGPSPKPADASPSIPTQTHQGTPRSGATEPAHSAPAGLPPTSP
ncbi:hypothetical protein ACFUS2_00735 [[Kitasatospora] papulosa]|uniref:zinc finger domain-containing protein n=1 Tax=[Kitasatospora] papulosa TaxID=1464011 RepID=UPI00363D4426